MNLSGSGRERVCSQCGYSTDSLDYRDRLIHFSSEDFGRSPESELVYGRNLGTNVADRNPDGSSDSYALRGDNGKYNPVMVAVQRWFLQNIIEPEAEMRFARENLTDIGQRNGFNEAKLHFLGKPLVSEITIMIDAKNRRRIDSYTKGDSEPKIARIYTHKKATARFLKDMLSRRRNLLE